MYILVVNLAVSTDNPSLPFPTKTQNMDEDQAAMNEQITKKPAILCPEVYTGVKNFHNKGVGFTVAPCDWGADIQNILTVILMFNANNYRNRKDVTKALDKDYPGIKVITIIQINDFIYLPGANETSLKQIKVQRTESLATVLNELTDKIVTDYIFIGRNLVHYNEYSQLHRLIRVISSNNVQVVGGSYRNQTGHWTPGCDQIVMKNYALKLLAGYKKSMDGCMLCHHISGSFVLSKNLTRIQKFSNFPENLMFLDFFLNLMLNNMTVASCIDVMFYASQGLNFDENSHWTKLVTKWALNSVTLPNNVKLQFTCKELNINCKYTLTQQYLTPPCCIEYFRETLKCLTSVLDKHSVRYEVIEGSSLGAVKFSGYMPWDIDGDISYKVEDEEKIFGLKSEFAKKGCPLSDQKCSRKERCYVVRVQNASHMFIDFIPRLPQRKPLLDNYHKYPTKVNFEGFWLSTYHSPGFFARNKYGADYLQHSRSWRFTGGSSPHHTYSAGKFPTCFNNYSSDFNPYLAHACLGNFPADGNLDFNP